MATSMGKKKSKYVIFAFFVLDVAQFSHCEDPRCLECPFAAFWHPVAGLCPGLRAGTLLMIVALAAQVVVGVAVGVAVAAGIAVAVGVGFAVDVDIAVLASDVEPLQAL